MKTSALPGFPLRGEVGPPVLGWLPGPTWMAERRAPTCPGRQKCPTWVALKMLFLLSSLGRPPGRPDQPKRDTQ